MLVRLLCAVRCQTGPATNAKAIIGSQQPVAFHFQSMHTDGDWSTDADECMGTGQIPESVTVLAEEGVPKGDVEEGARGQPLCFIILCVATDVFFASSAPCLSLLIFSFSSTTNPFRPLP